MAASSWDRLVDPWEEEPGNLSDPDAWGEPLPDSPEEAGKELAEELLDMYFGQTKMPARSLCSLCWWAAKAGAVGQV